MDRYTGPWAPGMQSVPDRNGRVYRVFRAPALRDGSAEEQRLGPPIADALCVAKVGPYERGEDMIFELDEDDAPDWTDGATVGALAQAVRGLYAEPRLSAIHFLGIDGGQWGIGRFEFQTGTGTYVFIPIDPAAFDEVSEPAAWLAAYHAHKGGGGS